MFLLLFDVCWCKILQPLFLRQRYVKQRKQKRKTYPIYQPIFCKYRSFLAVASVAVCPCAFHPFFVCPAALWPQRLVPVAPLRLHAVAVRPCAFHPLVSALLPCGRNSSCLSPLCVFMPLLYALVRFIPFLFVLLPCGRNILC